MVYTTSANILNQLHSDWDFSTDPWDDSKPDSNILIEAYNLDPTPHPTLTKQETK